MAVEELISDFFDTAEFKKQQTLIIAGLEEIKLLRDSLYQVKVDLGAANKGKEITTSLKEAGAATTAFAQQAKIAQTEFSKLLDLNKQASTDLKIKTQEATLAQKQLTLEITKAKEEARLKAIADKEAAVTAKKASEEAQAAATAKILILQKEKEAEAEIEREKQRVADREEKRISAEEAKARRLAEIPERLRIQNEKDAAEEAARAARKKADEERSAATPAISEETKAIDKLSESYGGLVEASVKNKLESKQLAEQRRLLTKEFKENKISEEQYELGLGEIEVSQLRVSRSGQDINRALRNVSAGASAAEGSLNKLRAQLNTSLQALDSLGAAEKKSDIGKSLQKNINALTAEITAQEEATGRFQRNVGNYASALEGVNSVVSDLFTGVVAYVGIDSLGQFLEDSIDEFNQAEQSISRLKNILENVGRADVFSRLTADANEFANAYKQLDNDDITQVFTQLITYGKLTENQIKQVTPVIIDFAAKTGLSLEDAAQKIILGLEGQGRAFKEFGINIKDASDPAEAFGLIMTELKPKVEGAAKAFGETTAGQVAITKQEINNLKEDIGGKLQPALRNFYSFLSQALSGLPTFFNGIDNGIQKVADSFKLIGKLTGQVLTGNVAGAASTIALGRAQIELNAKALAQEKEIANIKKQAKDIAADASAKPLAEQQKALKDQLAIETASFKVYDDLVKSGKKFTAEGKAAGVELFKNLEISKQLKAVVAQSGDTSVLGSGDADRDFKANNAKNSNEKLKAINKKFFDDELKEQADALKAIASNDAFYFTDRIEKRTKAYDIERKLIEDQAAFEIRQETEKLSLVTNDPKSSTNARINAQNEYNARVQEITEKSGFTLRKLETNLGTDLLKIRNQLNKASLDQAKADNEAAMKLFDEQDKARLEASKKRLSDNEVGLNKRNDFLNIGRDIELKQLDERRALSIANHTFDKQEVEKYEKDKLKIENYYNRLSLLAQLDYAEDYLKILKDLHQDTTAQEAKIVAIRLKIAKTGNDQTLDAAKKQQQDLVDLFSQIADVYNQVTDVLGKAADVGFTKQKNDLQDLIDLGDKKKQKDIDAINATTASEQDKAAKISIIEARANAQKEQYQAKQRQIDQKKAFVDKEIAVGQIIIQTALSVSKVLSVPPLAILVAALGAAQLAIALATPIPKYKYGTKNHPGGLAIMGDGGKKEFAHLPDGTGFVTSDKATLYDLPKGAQVHPDADKLNAAMLRASFKVVKMPGITINNGNDKMVKDLTKELRSLKAAINNKPVAKILNTYGGVRTSFENAHRQWEWINRNMQS